MFWTPVKKISSTEYIDEGTVRYFNDTSPNLGLMFGLNRWDEDRTATAYELVHFIIWVNYFELLHMYNVTFCDPFQRDSEYKT